MSPGDVCCMSPSSGTWFDLDRKHDAHRSDEGRNLYSEPEVLTVRVLLSSLNLYIFIFIFNS